MTPYLYGLYKVLNTHMIFDILNIKTNCSDYML